MASETVDPIDWSHPPPSWAVLPERLVHSINQCRLSGTRTCNRSMRVNHLAYAVTQGMKLIQWHMYQGSLLFPIFRDIYFPHRRAAFTVIHLLLKATFTSSIQPILGLHRTALHRHPPSTPFWPYGTHPFIPHAQTISILSDLFYLLTPFLFQLPYAPLHS